MSEEERRGGGRAKKWGSQPENNQWCGASPAPYLEPAEVRDDVARQLVRLEDVAALPRVAAGALGPFAFVEPDGGLLGGEAAGAGAGGVAGKGEEGSQHHREREEESRGSPKLNKSGRRPTRPADSSGLDSM